MRATTTPWQRFSDRLEGLPPSEVLHEGVPRHLEQPLREWIYRAMERGPIQVIALRLEITIESHRAGGDPNRFLAVATPAEGLLDVIDAILGAVAPGR